jgi:hypothetical protein
MADYIKRYLDWREKNISSLKVYLNIYMCKNIMLTQEKKSKKLCGFYSLPMHKETFISFNHMFMLF